MMGWVYEEYDYDSGDVTTPHEINQEFVAAVGEFNGMLDRDNFSGDIALDRFEAQTFNKVQFARSDSAGTGVTITFRDVGTSWKDVDDLEIDATTPDCELEVIGNMAWLWETDISGGGGTGVYIYIQVALMVDGEIVAEADPEFFAGHRSLNSTYGTGEAQWGQQSLSARVPVGAGTHTIKMVWRMYPNQDYSEIPSYSGVTATVTPYDRILWVREVRR